MKHKISFSSKILQNNLSPKYIYLHKRVASIEIRIAPKSEDNMLKMQNPKTVKDGETCKLTISCTADAAARRLMLWLASFKNFVEFLQ